MSLRVLLVEDDRELRATLRDVLRVEGYEVLTAASLSEGLALLAHAGHAADDPGADLVVLDLGLPDLDGLEVCRRLRTMVSVPIIVLSARTTESEKVAALDFGADDYVTKPFGPEELLARIRVALRRRTDGDPASTGPVTAGDLTIDPERHRVVRDGVEIRLTPKELELLTLLARNRDRVLTNRAILKAIWGGNAVEQPEHLWTLMSQLRKKIEPDPSQPRYLRSEPWVGYRFSTSDEP
jgi:two-component system KDP operon response regulator KdpE